METWQNLETVVLEHIAQARQQLDTAAQEQRRFGILIPHKIEAQHTTPTPRAAKAQQTLSSLATQEQEREQFVTLLKERGLAPLGVLPATVFNRLCQRWCYRFQHLNQESGCNIEMSLLTKAARLITALLAAIQFLTAIYLVASCMKATAGGVGIIYFMCSVLLIFFTVEMMAEASAERSLYRKPFILNGVTWGLVRLLPKRLLFRLLWSKKHDSQSRFHVTITFAEVNDNFRQTLLQLEQAGIQPMVAAVPMAISLDRRQILAAFKEVGQEEARLAELARRRDPILYHTRGNWTAIFAQSGKFASEKRIMRAAQKYAPLAI